MTQAVDSDELFSSARVYVAVRSASGTAVQSLGGALSATAGMAGTDSGAHAWSQKYDPMAKSLMEVGATVVRATGQCSDLLYATGVNHLVADGKSAISNETVLELPPMGAPSFVAPAAPSAEGGHGDVPGWWHTISAYVQGELWPNGHQDKLRSAADGWRNAGTELRSAAGLVNGDRTPWARSRP